MVLILIQCICPLVVLTAFVFFPFWAHKQLWPGGWSQVSVDVNIALDSWLSNSCDKLAFFIYTQAWSREPMCEQHGCSLLSAACKSLAPRELTPGHSSVSQHELLFQRFCDESSVVVGILEAVITMLLERCCFRRRSTYMAVDRRLDLTDYAVCNLFCHLFGSICIKAGHSRERTGCIVSSSDTCSIICWLFEARQLDDQF